jgi:hypothetical protein
VRRGALQDSESTMPEFVLVAEFDVGDSVFYGPEKRGSVSQDRVFPPISRRVMRRSVEPEPLMPV